jgi:hypothetical protein
MSGSVRARGYVVFESSTPGQYNIPIKSPKRTFRYDCVGGGAGGFVGRVGIKFNPGRPEETTLIGTTGISGCSGAYTSSTTRKNLRPNKTLRVTVGAAGSAYYTTNTVKIFDYGDPEEDYFIPSYVGGGDSKVEYLKSNGTWGNITVATGGICSKLRFWTDHFDWIQIAPGGNTIRSNFGKYSYGGSNISLSGGSSTYNGHGEGGSAGWGGQYPSETPWGNNGGKGYVKITVAD